METIFEFPVSYVFVVSYAMITLRLKPLVQHYHDWNRLSNEVTSKYWIQRNRVRSIRRLYAITISESNVLYGSCWIFRLFDVCPQQFMAVAGLYGNSPYGDHLYNIRRNILSLIGSRVVIDRLQ